MRGFERIVAKARAQREASAGPAQRKMQLADMVMPVLVDEKLVLEVLWWKSKNELWAGGHVGNCGFGEKVERAKVFFSYGSRLQ
jgi:hypothetical protein